VAAAETVIARVMAAVARHACAEQPPFGAAQHIKHLAHNSLFVCHQMLHAPQPEAGIVRRCFLLRARHGQMARIVRVDGTCVQPRR